MTSRDDDGAAAPESERAGMAGMGHAPPPAMPDAYEVALGRLLDGLEAEPADADGIGNEADERASADIALIRRGLGLIAAELAGGTASAAASAADEPVVDVGPAEPLPGVIPLAPVRASGQRRPAEPRRAGDAHVLPLPRPSAIEPDPVPESQPARAAWWRRPAPAVLAAAASLTLVLTLGVSVLDSDGDGGDSTAQQAPAAAADARAAGSAMEADRNFDSPTAATAAAPKAAKAAAAPAMDAAAPAADAAAPAADAAAPAAGSAAYKASRSKTSFAETVACARAIVVGEVVKVEDVAGTDRARVTFEISEYLKGEGMTTRSFVVGSRSARFGEEVAPLVAGQRGLFVVPQSKDTNVRGWLDDDVPTGRKKVLAAMEERGGC